MNAYEFADELSWNELDTDEIETWTKEAVFMLRKQADRIAELEKDLVLKTRDRDVFRDFTLAYEKRIEELEKHLKKVQWALAQHVDILGEMGWHQVNKDGYTTPQTKPLSDEEIDKLMKETKDWYEFAKAIEAKVRGEK